MRQLLLLVLEPFPTQSVFNFRESKEIVRT
ncbi:unnamed protein product [Acanthoscelides obtectus]|uniref:Uncharacterized protein n=1 Tax=Acanthoscelides obtectus TaxID=200917 RepID=A0A9P0LHU2_ACAOB|nr:unnamed protein product [Acanthoscelides obtectus]CAK1664173.1 hypothetical protein AOBTE_LOCUS24098 [Acanthoscelides obtectus]